MTFSRDGVISSDSGYKSLSIGSLCHEIAVLTLSHYSILTGELLPVTLSLLKVNHPLFLYGMVNKMSIYLKLINT